MADQPPSWNANLPPGGVERRRRPRERAWTIQTTLRAGAERIDCDFVGHGEYGWEVVLSKNGKWHYNRRFPTRAEAEIEAGEWRSRYLAAGGALGD